MALLVCFFWFLLRQLFSTSDPELENPIALVNPHCPHLGTDFDPDPFIYSLGFLWSISTMAEGEGQGSGTWFSSARGFGQESLGRELCSGFGCLAHTGFLVSLVEPSAKQLTTPHTTLPI